MIAALTCAFFVPTLAGDIPTDGFNAPTPDEIASTTSSTSPGDVPSVDYTTAESETMLNFLQLMVGLLV
jgi:hypothetical protein